MYEITLKTLEQLAKEYKLDVVEGEVVIHTDSGIVNIHSYLTMLGKSGTFHAVLKELVASKEPIIANSTDLSNRLIINDGLAIKLARDYIASHTVEINNFLDNYYKESSTTAARAFPIQSRCPVCEGDLVNVRNDKGLFIVCIKCKAKYQCCPTMEGDIVGIKLDSSPPSIYYNPRGRD